MSIKNGGAKLGEGKSGIVYDLCNAEDYEKESITFCDIYGAKLENITTIEMSYILEEKPGKYELKIHTITDHKVIHDLFASLGSGQNENIVAKVYKNTTSFLGLGVKALKSYNEENNSILNLQNELGALANHTTIGFLKYNKLEIIGMKIVEKSFLEDPTYVSFSSKCTSTIEDMCRKESPFTDLAYLTKMISSVLDILIELQKRDIAHGDLKPGNVMICNETWKLIDWNMARKLNLETLQAVEKGIVKRPMHRGTSPFYWMLHNFTYYDIMIKNYVDDFMMAQFNKKMFKGFFDYMEESIYSFKAESDKNQVELFEKFKYHGDLHSFGLMIYALNKLYLNNNEIEKFSRRLCINDYNIILNAEAAKAAFISIQTGGKSNIRYEKRTRKSLLELAKVRRIHIPSNATKALIISILRGSFHK